MCGAYAVSLGKAATSVILANMASVANTTMAGKADYYAIIAANALNVNNAMCVANTKSVAYAMPCLLPNDANAANQCFESGSDVTSDPLTPLSDVVIEVNEMIMPNAVKTVIAVNAVNATYAVIMATAMIAANAFFAVNAVITAEFVCAG